MPRRTAEESDATRAALVAAGRRLWSERGYAAVGTEEVARAAGVTRGALYHHFADKRALFRAVFVAAEQEAVQAIAAAALAEADPFRQLVVGAETMVAHAAEPVARITFLEGPGVLGYDEWRSIVEEFSLGLIQMTLQQAMDAGAIRRAAPEPLAHVILAALNGAGSLVARGGEPEQVNATLTSVLEGLRPVP